MIDMTGIDPLPSGHFRVRVQHAKEVLTGTVATLDEALELRDALKREIVDIVATPARGMSLHAMGPRFLASRSGNRDSKTDTGRWHKHIATAPFARRPLTTVTKLDGMSWLKALKATETSYDPKKHGERAKKPLSWQTRKHCLNLARRALAWAMAIEQGYITENPFRDLEVEREDGDEDEGFQDGWYLDAKDQAKLFALWDSTDWTPSRFTKDDVRKGFAERRRAEKHIVEFAMGTGVRQGELACLHLADVVVDGPEPHIVVRFGSWDNVKKRYRSPKGRKGEKKTRTVPLFGLALDAARAWLALLPTYAPKNPLGLMFPTENGKRRDKKPPKSWERVAETFGVVPRIGKPIWWHLLRHTCASSLVSGAWGMRWTLEDVSKVLGHTSIKTTEIYAHLAPSAVQSTATRAQAAWSGRHAAVTPIRAGVTKHRENKLHATEDSNLRPTAPEASGSGNNAQVIERRDGAVTALVGALRSVEEGHPAALRIAVDAMGVALTELLATAPGVQVPQRGSK